VNTTAAAALAGSGNGTAPALKLMGTQVVPGYLRGLAQPCLRVYMELAANADPVRCAPVEAALEPLPVACSIRCVDGLPPTARHALPFLLAEWLVRLQASAGMVVWSGVVLEILRPLPGHPQRLEAMVLVPTSMPGVLIALVAPLVEHVNALLQDTPADPAALLRLVEELARWAPGGTNNRHFLREAGALGMPVLQLPGGVFQMGWGRRSRLFRSSITDSTSAVATAWAKDKSATNALLHMAGLPVPAQRAVGSLDAALKAASQIGYPVVIKPVNLDQGVGVEADLRDETDLRAAHSRAVRHGSPLVLEKHVPGEDYRVFVINGELLGVAHRKPAQVVGDGIATVAQLVEQVNAQRGRATVYKPIELDAEALDLMDRAGFEPVSVVPAGQVLRLRRSANSSRGGTSQDATHLVHPDNVALCVQAAGLLRLDIAGLDLLISDIARSWREVGAAFCEVNAQPQMGGSHPWIFKRILRRYLVGKGRVPAVLVLTGACDGALGGAVAQALEGGGWKTVLVQGNDPALLQRCRAAVMQPDLGAVVVQTDGAGLARQGVPLDRFDVLVVSGWTLAGPLRQPVLTLLAPHVGGMALVDEVGSAAGTGNASDHSCRPVLLRRLGAQRVQMVPDTQALPAAVLCCVQALPDGG
jgi:cyanophycin synthetase